MQLNPDDKMDSRLAPIVLFVYNRPLHTRQTLEALSKNILADKSVLYIFADGAKAGASEKDITKIAEVRSIAKTGKWCKEVYLIERKENLGLANSVIQGVTEIISKHGKVIVLEDDLVTGKGFLKYMNTALGKYEFQEQVMQVSGHCFPSKDILKANSSFFIPLTTSWGWGTWKRAWNKFDPMAKGYEALRSDKKMKHAFNLDGGYLFSDMMFNQMDAGKINSWAIRWWWCVFREKGLVLFPDKSLVANIGYDVQGTHTKGENPFPLDFDDNYFILDFPDNIQINNAYFSAIKEYIKNAGSDISPRGFGSLIKKIKNLF